MSLRPGKARGPLVTLSGTPGGSGSINGVYEHVLNPWEYIITGDSIITALVGNHTYVAGQNGNSDTISAQFAINRYYSDTSLNIEWEFITAPSVSDVVYTYDFGICAMVSGQAMPACLLTDTFNFNLGNVGSKLIYHTELNFTPQGTLNNTSFVQILLQKDSQGNGARLVNIRVWYDITVT